MWENIKSKGLTKHIVLLLVLAIVSMFILSWSTASSPANRWALEELDNKKISVTEYTLATAAAATAIAAVPSDSTTPMAQQIMNISGYLFLVVCLIALEKMIVTLTSYLSFGIFIPLACILYILFLCKEKKKFGDLSVKLFSFGLAIVMLVPASIAVGNVIEKTFDLTIEQVTAEANTTAQEVEEELSWFEKITGAITGVTEKAKEGFKKTLSNCIDTVAVLIVSNLVIPIAILYMFMWIIKSLFGINIDTNALVKKVKKSNKQSSKMVTNTIQNTVNNIVNSHSEEISE